MKKFHVHVTHSVDYVYEVMATDEDHASELVDAGKGMCIFTEDAGADAPWLIDEVEEDNTRDIIQELLNKMSKKDKENL